MDTTYLIITGVIALTSMFVSSMLKRKFDQYSKLRLANGLSGAEIAQKMLHDHGIHDVKITSTPGRLTDHYNPLDKTVNLSQSVYNERNASAAAVAAHEVGHAVQHAKGYKMLQFRSKMVPVVNISSKILTFVLMGGIALMAATNGEQTLLLKLGILMFGFTTFFTFITLPVEYDASKRALAWLKDKNMVQAVEYDGAKDALKWAARTYVVSALGSLAQLMYFLNMLNNRRE